MNKAIKDHLGNEYSTMKEMFEQYGITAKKYYRGIANGWSLEDILTTVDSILDSNGASYVEEYKDEQGCFCDHEGNKFASRDDLCDAWGVDSRAFLYRMQRGWSLEKALTKGGHPKEVIVGTAYKVFGVYYPSLRSICRAYGIKQSSTIGNTTSEIESYLASRALIRYEGKTFKSMTELSQHYGIEVRLLGQRLFRGWTLYKALHTPVGSTNRGIPCKDHKGNTYLTMTDMTQHYGLPVHVYYNRIKNGWSQEDALETPAKSYRHNNILSNEAIIEMIKKEQADSNLVPQ